MDKQTAGQTELQWLRRAKTVAAVARKNLLVCIITFTFRNPK